MDDRTLGQMIEDYKRREKNEKINKVLMIVGTVFVIFMLGFWCGKIVSDNIWMRQIAWSSSQEAEKTPTDVYRTLGDILYGY